MQLPWRKSETDLDREVHHHLAELAAQYGREGLSRQDARAKARREFGAAELIKDQCRDESRWRWFHELRQDVTFGARMMKAAPIVTAAAVLSLALGIGANTAIVSLMDLVLFRPLPVAAPEQLTFVRWIAESHPEGPLRGGAGSCFPINQKRVCDFLPAAFEQRAAQAAAGQAELARFVSFPVEISTSFRGHAAVVRERAVGGNFLRVLGVQPVLGRSIEPADDQATATPITVVSHRYWRQHLGADPGVVGQSMRVNNEPRVIAGVLPQEFYGLDLGDSTDLYTPMRHSVVMQRMGNSQKADQGGHWYTALVARRQPGVTEAQLLPRWNAAFPSTWAAPPKNPRHAPSIHLDRGAQGTGGIRRSFEKPLLILTALVAMVLLIACANIANLLLARGEARAREIALRLSLGCSRARLLRQLLTESAMLAAIGGAASLVFALGTANLLGRLAPGSDTPLDVPLDYRMVLFALAATVATTLLFGLYPAWRAARTQINGELKQRSQRLGHALVAAQVALTVILVASAALFTRSLQGILSVNAGFRTSNLIMFGVNPGQLNYSGAKLANFYREAERRLNELPGVESAGFSQYELMRGGGWWMDIHATGDTKALNVFVNAVTPGFLEAQGIVFRAGRPFTPADLGKAPGVAIVSEDIAQQISSPVLGRRIGFKPDQMDREIVGVIASVHQHRLKEKVGSIYLPVTGEEQTMTALVRTTAPTQAAMPMIIAAMRELDRDLPLVKMRTMEDQIGTLHKRERLFAYLCGGFGVLALALSAVGLYGVMSYATSRREREIGVRMALGATPRRVVHMILREGLLWVILGLAAGTPFVYWGAEYVKKELFQITPFDPVALSAAAATLLAATLIAALLPAWRAARLNPQTALRRD